MECSYYQRKINDVIMKCPIEAGVEILVYNVLDSIIDSKKLSLVDINRIRKNRDPRLTTEAGIPDIAVLSNDFKFKSDMGQVYGFIEVKAINKLPSETEQVIGQQTATNHYLHTNGLVWKYYEGKKHRPMWKICLNQSPEEYVTCTTKVCIDENKFKDLINKLEDIIWTSEEKPNL